jgi:hypothetical protein
LPLEPQAEANPPAVTVDKLPGFALAPAAKRKHATAPMTVPATATATAISGGSGGLWAVALQNHAPPPPPALTDLNERPAMMSPGTAR